MRQKPWTVVRVRNLFAVERTFSALPSSEVTAKNVVSERMPLGWALKALLADSRVEAFPGNA
jgi:hypothetical protein